MQVNRLRNSLRNVPDVTPVSVHVDSMSEPYEMTAGELRSSLGKPVYEGRWTFPIGVPGSADYPPLSERYPDVRWQKTNGVGVQYILNGKNVYHTGDDLNLPGFQDIGEPVHSPAEGMVTFVGYVPNSTWGNVLVIRLVVNPSTFVYTRFAHLNSIEVKQGETVMAGQVVAYVGNVGMPDVPHLHWDMTKENDPLLGNIPKDWPGENLVSIQTHYTDPGKYVGNKIRGETTEPTMTSFKKVVPSYLRVRSEPGISASVLSVIPSGAVLEVEDRTIFKDSYHWTKILTAVDTPNLIGGYVAMEFLRDTADITPEKRVVTTAAINIRSGPGTSYAVQGQLTQGTIVYVTNTVGSGLSAWRKLVDGRGWIAEWLTSPF